jgi:hypothetical protein
MRHTRYADHRFASVFAQSPIVLVVVIVVDSGRLGSVKLLKLRLEVSRGSAELSASELLGGKKGTEFEGRLRFSEREVEEGERVTKDCFIVTFKPKSRG